jgi:hypothetical protein
MVLIHNDDTAKETSINSVYFDVIFFSLCPFEPNLVQAIKLGKFASFSS